MTQAPVTEFARAHQRLQERRQLARIPVRVHEYRRRQDLINILGLATIMIWLAGIVLSLALQPAIDTATSSHRLSTPHLWSTPQ